MSDLTDRARRLVADATPGPWEVQTSRYNDLHFGDCGPAAGVTMPASPGRGFFVPGFRETDAALIAAAPTLVPELCDAVDAAMAVAKRYRDGWVPRKGKWLRLQSSLVDRLGPDREHMTSAEVAVIEQLEAGE